MKIVIKALDTLFFKDGKPFSMGDETWADGIFPPPPSVIYGALRSAYFGQNPNEFKNVCTDNDPTKELQINNIFYRIKGANYFPLPLDFVTSKNKNDTERNREKREETYQVKLLSTEFNNIIHNKNENLKFFGSTDEVKSYDDGLINISDFTNYLKGNLNDFKCRRIKDYVLTEAKIGIGRNDITRTTQESKLYRVGLNRLKDFSLVVDLNDDFKDKFTNFLKFGAEGKISVFQDDTFTYSEFGFAKNDSNKFKIYISTPAIFENGWVPDFIDKTKLTGKFNNIDVKLYSAFIGKPLFIGGFDMLKKIPKPMKKFVPAGSVYYFKVLNESKLSDLNLSNENFNIHSTGRFFINNSQYSKQGFGISYLVNINN